MNNQQLSVQEVHDLPADPKPDCIYVLLPKNYSREYYLERTDRNLGWICREEQELIYGSTVGIAGCGGMGGLIAAIITRLGVGTLLIFEPETFDVSNINRQFAATKLTVGKSKAFETARMVREIADDVTLIVCPEGLTQKNLSVLKPFITRCDLILDEIEFWAVGARLTLHDITRDHDIPVINCNTVGHRTYLWYFSRHGMPLHKCMEMNTGDAWVLQKRIQRGIAGKNEILHVKEKVMKVFLPEVPEYATVPEQWSTVRNWHCRLENEGRAMVISTNPPMASGFTANHVLFQLLAKKSPIKRNFVLPPQMPGYLMFDAALMKTEIVTTLWW